MQIYNMDQLVCMIVYQSVLSNCYSGFPPLATPTFTVIFESQLHSNFSTREAGITIGLNTQQWHIHIGVITKHKQFHTFPPPTSTWEQYPLQNTCSSGRTFLWQPTWSLMHHQLCGTIFLSWIGYLHSCGQVYLKWQGARATNNPTGWQWYTKKSLSLPFLPSKRSRKGDGGCTTILG